MRCKEVLILQTGQKLCGYQAISYEQRVLYGISDRDRLPDYTRTSDPQSWYTPGVALQHLSGAKTILEKKYGETCWQKYDADGVASNRGRLGHWYIRKACRGAE